MPSHPQPYISNLQTFLNLIAEDRGIEFGNVFIDIADSGNEYICGLAHHPYINSRTEIRGWFFQLVRSGYLIKDIDNVIDNVDKGLKVGRYAQH